MLTWHIDRLIRFGTVCALATFLIPTALAALVEMQSAEENVLGIMLVASGIVFVGTLAGSAVTSGLGVLLFCLGTFVAEVSAWVMVVVGVALFATMVVHDLAGAFHRAPRINRAVWVNAARMTAAVAVAGAGAFTLSYAIATLAVWQSIVVPFGVVAIGFGAKLAADAHRSRARQLTAKRAPDPAEDR